MEVSKQLVDAISSVCLYNNSILIFVENHVSIYELADIIAAKSKKLDNSRHLQNFSKRIMDEVPTVCKTASDFEYLLGKEIVISSHCIPQNIPMYSDPMSMESIIDSFKDDKNLSDLSKASTKIPVRAYYIVQFDFILASY